MPQSNSLWQFDNHDSVLTLTCGTWRFKAVLYVTPQRACFWSICDLPQATNKISHDSLGSNDHPIKTKQYNTIQYKGWSLLPNALRPFQIYRAPPNLGITRTRICRLNFGQRPIFSGLRFSNESEISDSGPPA